MKIIDICEIILMIAGIVFYSVCLFFFIIGKIKPDNNITTISIGKVDFSSNSFIVMALISALFAFSPLIYNHFSPAKSVATDSSQITDKTNRTFPYSINGQVEDSHGNPLHNISITAYQTRNDSLLIKKVKTTQRQGNFDVTFDTVKPSDELIVAWEDPQGDTIKNNFSPVKATLNIPIKSK